MLFSGSNHLNLMLLFLSLSIQIFFKRKRVLHRWSSLKKTQVYSWLALPNTTLALIEIFCTDVVKFLNNFRPINTSSRNYGSTQPALALRWSSLLLCFASIVRSVTSHAFISLFVLFTKSYDFSLYMLFTFASLSSLTLYCTRFALARLFL